MILGTGRQQITGSGGEFRIDSLSPGTWQLRVACLGCFRPPVVPFTLQAGQEVEIVIDVWHPMTRSDTCGVALDWSRQRWEHIQEFVRDTVRAFSARLGLPEPVEVGSGLEVRFWSAWWLTLYNHLLWIRQEGDTVSGTLFRWWRDDSEWPVPRQLADAHRQAGTCEALWEDAGDFLCRIRLDSVDVRPFLDSLAAHAHDLRGQPSLHPADSGDCRLAIPLDPPTTLMELSDSAGWRWYGLHTSLGVWPSRAVTRALQDPVGRIVARY